MLHNTEFKFAHAPIWPPPIGATKDRKAVMRTAYGLIGAAVIGMALGGCASERVTRDQEHLQADREKLVAELIDSRIAFSYRVIHRVRAKIDQAEREGTGEATLDILVLSGGGDYGAFGAGVLKGWGQVSDPVMTRPVFDVVSGVSTGALIAPFAYVGTEEAYERAYELYQDPKPDWFKERGLISFLFRRESFMDNSGLRRDVKAAIDDEMLKGIARKAEEDRPLLIGTTNMDMGLMVMWDAGLEAKRVVDGVRDSRDRFDDILIASTSIPGAFPPVEIDGDLYVDGGVTRNIAYTTDQDYENSSVNIWKREFGNRPYIKVRFWVIINNQLGTAPRGLQAGWPALMKRSLEMSIRSSTIGSLKALSLALEVQRDRGLDGEFRYIAIPDDWRAPVEGVFVKETMTDLAQLGYRLGQDPENWKVVVPNPESP